MASVSIQLQLLNVDHRKFDEFCRMYETYSIPENPIFKYWEKRKLEMCPHTLAKECNCLQKMCYDNPSVETWNIIVDNVPYKVAFVCIEFDNVLQVGCLFYNDEIVMTVEDGGDCTFPKSKDDNEFTSVIREYIKQILSARHELLYDPLKWSPRDNSRIRFLKLNR